MTTILDLNAEEARSILTHPTSYWTSPLPPYFNFETVLNHSRALVESGLTYRDQKKRIKSESATYRILVSKDGGLAWRPFGLVHPLLYVSACHKLTEPTNWEIIQNRFNEFRTLKNITCASLPPAETGIKHNKRTLRSWWIDVEQQSISYSMKYSNLAKLDITDCYGSIYTHVVPWALIGRDKAKAMVNHPKSIKLSPAEQNAYSLGKNIDEALRDMNYNQTNGIPQGNIYSDLIAELILGYADELIATRLEQQNISDYHIIRYRDDYRVFATNQPIAASILKEITRILADLNFNINTAKVEYSDDIITSSIKSWKTDLEAQLRPGRNLFYKLLHARKVLKTDPNCGAFAEFFDNVLLQLTKQRRRALSNYPVDSLVAICWDIAVRSPRYTPHTISLIAAILNIAPARENRKELLQTLADYASRLAHPDFLLLWLQRILILEDIEMGNMEKLGQYVQQIKSNNFTYRNVRQPWDSSWIYEPYRSDFQELPIVDIASLQDIQPVPEPSEYDSISGTYSD